MANQKNVSHSSEHEGRRGDGKPHSRAPDGGWTFVTQSNYDPTGSRDLTTVIVGAIAEADGVSVTEVLEPPLYEVVDVAAMERALFGRPGVSPNGTESTVEFRYNEYKVSVGADGWVTVSERSDEVEIGTGDRDRPRF